MGRAIYEAQKLEQKLKKDQKLEAVPTEQPILANSEATPGQGGLADVTNVERRLPIIVDATPGTAGGILGKKLLAPDHTNMTLLAV
jgi:hypothetical protein